MLQEEGISVEVIDLRTLWPYDWDHISAFDSENRSRIS